MLIRPTISSDIPALQNVLDATELFPKEMLPDLLQGFLSGDKSETELWLTCCETTKQDETPTGFCFASVEELTDRTWNMKAIAVMPSLQRSGFGRGLVQALEDALRARNQRILIVDTSSTDDYLPTRAFYQNVGYVEEGRIRDFWGEGDDKIVFWKSLN